MIEAPYPPTVWVVARGAIAAKGSLMHIVFFVACVAVVGVNFITVG